jgi:hypothetical protein
MRRVLFLERREHDEIRGGLAIEPTFLQPLR